MPASAWTRLGWAPPPEPIITIAPSPTLSEVAAMRSHGQSRIQASVKQAAVIIAA